MSYSSPCSSVLRIRLPSGIGRASSGLRNSDSSQALSIRFDVGSASVNATWKCMGRTWRNCQVMVVRKYDLPLAGLPRIERNSGSISSMARGIAQVAVRAGQAPAGHPPGVDRVAVDREPAGEEPLLPLGAEHRVAEQLDVLRDPQHLLGRERLPAMRARRPRQQPDRLGLGRPRVVFNQTQRWSPRSIPESMPFLTRRVGECRTIAHFSPWVQEHYRGRGGRRITRTMSTQSL